MDVRRVVTGHDAEGKAVFASDARVAPITTGLLPGTEFHVLWSADEAPHFPDSGQPPPLTTYFPKVGGFRFSHFTLPPGAQTEVPADLDIGAEMAKLDRELPGLMAHMEPDAPGMHTTSTIDFEVVLSGRVDLELDDGATVTLEPGDTVVQNGTRHRWSNPGEVPVVIAVFLVGADHDRVTAT